MSRYNYWCVIGSPDCKLNANDYSDHYERFLSNKGCSSSPDDCLSFEVNGQLGAMNMMINK